MRYNPQKHRKSKTRFDVAMAQRAQRPAARLPRVNGWLIAGVLAAALVVAGGVWFTGDAWRIGQIDVQNNTGVPVEAVIAASELQGEHYFFIDLDKAARQIDDLPGVEAARVTCQWNMKAACAVLIQPARAMALWESGYGNVWNDYEGRVQQATDGMTTQMRILVEDGMPPALDKPINAQLLRAVNELIALQPEVTRYVYSSEYGLIWKVSDDLQVRLGVAGYDGAMSDKLKLVRALRQQLAAQDVNVKVLDVRFPEAPYYIR
jgi:cell division septal protein FtsQ